MRGSPDQPRAGNLEAANGALNGCIWGTWHGRRHRAAEAEFSAAARQDRSQRAISRETTSAGDRHATTLLAATALRTSATDFAVGVALPQGGGFVPGAGLHR